MATLNSISDYFRNFRKFEKEPEKWQQQCSKSLRIAVLSSFSNNGFKEILTEKCLQSDIFPDIYIGGYNQYFQEIINPDSAFHVFSPQMIVLFIDTSSLLGDEYLLPYGNSEKYRKAWVETKIEELTSLVQTIKEKCAAKIVLHNFEVPSYSPVGILESKQPFGLMKSIMDLNNRLQEAYKRDHQVFVFDFETFCSKIGKENIIDHKMYYIGDFRLKLDLLPRLCDEYLGYVKPLLGMNKKCIVLDLDNTLWGGVIGEDEINGIHLGLTPEGRPFWELQKFLLSLYQRGIILAINSKNNYEDVLQVFKDHPYMVLKEEHFAALRINWNDKVTNIREIAEELNIGTDSLVFVDDDPLNREMVKSEFPEVLVVDLPEDPALYLSTMQNVNDFNTFQITNEDKNKGKMYVKQRQRKNYQKKFTNVTEYLARLEIEVIIEEATPFTIPRLSQLTQKTNQYNMTTRRYTEEDIRSIAEQDSYHVIALSVKDKFGDNGLTGMCVIKKDDATWEIDTWLLSCRIIGRKIEDVFLAYVLEKARKNNVTFLRGIFIPSKKNHPARSFFKDHGFKKIDAKDTIEYWEYDVNKEYPYPTFIKLIRR